MDDTTTTVAAETEPGRGALADMWPGVPETVEALKAAFGTAYIEHTGGGCHSIFLPIEGIGFFMIGDPDGPLGEDGDGFAVERHDPSGDYVGMVMRCERDPKALVSGLRAFLADGTRTGLTRRDLLVERRDSHHDETGHFVNSRNPGEGGCGECQAIYQGLQD